MISPMYKVFRLREYEREVNSDFLLQLLKSDPLIERYRNLGKGSVKRRKGVSFKKFASLRIPIPPSPVQSVIATKASCIQRLRNQIQNLESETDEAIHTLLGMVGMERR